MDNIEQLIKDAAEQASRNYIYAHDRTLFKDGFDVGASFAFQSPQLLKMVMGTFAEWLDAKGWVKTDAWHWGDDNYCQSYTTAELINLYFEHREQELIKSKNK